jgi:hypothetical protein
MPRLRSSAMRADDQARRRVAVEAARLISEQGIRDYHFAKRKAAERLGVPLDSALPKNSEIEQALREHQRLFAGKDHADHLRHLREVAAEALRFFAEFDPRLVGAVLDGSADRYSAVCLQLFADEPEAVARFLGERHIPFEEHDRELRLTRELRKQFPAFVFSADGTPVDLTVLPLALRRQAPLDRDGDKPMQRAGAATLQALLIKDSADAAQRPLSGT